MNKEEAIEMLKQSMKNTLKNIINSNDHELIVFASQLMIESSKMYVLLGGNLDEYYSLILQKEIEQKRPEVIKVDISAVENTLIGLGIDEKEINRVIKDMKNYNNKNRKQ